MKDEPSKGRERVAPVEELSDLQWARVERGLWQRLDAETAEAAMDAARGAGDAEQAQAQRARRQRRAWQIAAIAGGLAAAAALALAVWPRGAAPLISLDEPAREGEPARVVTSASATTVSFADAAIEVQPHSALLMSGSAERGATVVLESGRAGFHVAPREHRRPFVVMAGHAVVRVVGTRFEVARSGEVVSVKVREGIVDVRYLGELHQVIAGGEWHSQGASAPLQAAPLDAGAVDGDDGSGAGDGSANGDANGERASEPRPAVKEPADDRAQRVREREAAAAREREAAAARERETAAAREREAAAARARAEELTAARAAEFTAAAKLESSAPRQALERYLELAKQNDRWAQNALYAAARLALDVGQRARAAELAQAYLRRFPSGSNASDARALLEALP